MHRIEPFGFAPPPRIIFESGGIDRLPGLIGGMGNTALLVTGAGSYERLGFWEPLTGYLDDRGIGWSHVRTEGEPSPELIDECVDRARGSGVEVVAAVGGGSTIDSGKAISAMLKHPGSTADYLEGVGDPSKLTGDKVPFIAVPTTSGTGSEATKNAVLSRAGENGFKKSLRHDNFVPDLALVDAGLTLSCPERVTAACGMDAFSQLLESYVSTGASPLTDHLAFGALGLIRDCLVPACTDRGDDLNVRSGMSYAALVSGITLANAGLGVVHGIAGALGGLFVIPHGVACGTLLGACVSITVDKLKSDGGKEGRALSKFAAVGNLLCGSCEEDPHHACDLLVERIFEITEITGMPALGEFGVRERDLERIASASGNKRNPAALDSGEIAEALRRRL